MDSPLRLIPADPLDQLARTLEALLVVASAPLPVEELAAAADDDPERVEDALRLVADRFAEGRSGIVLEHVAGGWAFRAGREEAAACARLFERPAQRNISQAALETLAIVAYLGPCSRPDIARIRGVAADSSGREPPRARSDRRSGSRQRGRRSHSLSHDTALRARLRPREPLGAPAPRRRGRRRSRDPRPPDRGRRETQRLGRNQVPGRVPASRVRQSFLMMVSASSRVNARRVSVCSAPCRASCVTIWSAVSSSGASNTSTTS